MKKPSPKIKRSPWVSIFLCSGIMGLPRFKVLIRDQDMKVQNAAPIKGAISCPIGSLTAHLQSIEGRPQVVSEFQHAHDRSGLHGS